MDNNSEKLCYSVQEAARVCDICVNGMRALTHAEGFPAVWLSPRRCVIPKDRLREWLNQQADTAMHQGIGRTST